MFIQVYKSRFLSCDGTKEFVKIQEIKEFSIETRSQGNPDIFVIKKICHTSGGQRYPIKLYAKFEEVEPIFQKYGLLPPKKQEDPYRKEESK